MPAYVWRCYSCGNSNAATSESCATCECPSHCTVREAENFRMTYVGRGGSISPNTPGVKECSEVSALEVLSAILMPLGLLLFGILPSGWRNSSGQQGPVKRKGANASQSSQEV